MKWEEVRLGDVLQIKHGWAFKGKYFSDNGKYILLSPGNFFEEGGFRLRENKEKFYLGEFPKDYLLKKDDLIIAMTEQGAGLLGSPALIPENERFLHNQRLGLFHTYNEKIIFKKYLYYLFFTKNIRGLIAGSATGTKVKHTAPKRIYDISIKLPPLKTQKKIAKILSNYDDLIENNLKQIKLLEEKARLTYEEWFLRFRVDGVELEIDSESGLPFGWKTNKFKNVLKFKTGKLNSNAVVENGKYDFYTCAKEIFKTNTFTFDEEVVLLGGNNATGNFSLFYVNGKFDVYQRTYVITSTIFPSVYIYFVIQNYLPFFKNISSGATTKFLTMQILNLMPIVKPSNEILDKFEEKIKPIFDRFLNLNQQNQNLKEARDILLPRLMTGVIEL